jgi:hypothetical protein
MNLRFQMSGKSALHLQEPLCNDHFMNNKTVEVDQVHSVHTPRPHEGPTPMLKKRRPLEWALFFIVLAMVVALIWLAQYLDKASF